MTDINMVSGNYPYSTVAGDPMGVRTYILKNGLTVMLSVNKAEPRVQAMIAVKAGSKNDPATNTGLAHYLEHMMFKGTGKFGTLDFETEKKYLDQIDALYEEYNHTSDEAKRAEIYKRIDSVSGVAAKYAIPNEYDKMMQSLGVTGTNAFTSVEETVYINNIPVNQLETWLKAESERFLDPVFRIFHTELETVYEEKNRGLDNDDVKADEALMEALFRKHPYGTQTTIGTVEHLKNPSLLEIKKYYQRYYVPNNMGVIMSGDIDFDTTIELIDKYFSVLKPADIPVFSFEPEEPRIEPDFKTVLGPKAEDVYIAYRLPGASSKEARLLKVAHTLMYNRKAGLMDINLVKAQRILEGYSDIAVFKDYSYQVLSAKPKKNQTLEEVYDLLIAEVNKIKNGDFDEKLLQAIVNNLEVSEIHRQENNMSRSYNMLNAFVTSRNWEDAVNDIAEIKKFSKADIVAFANKWYTQDHVVVYKKTGDDTSIVKIPKPPITPLELNRDSVSPFAESILKTIPEQIKPVFLDYKNVIQTVQLQDDLPLMCLKNTENKRFSLYFVLDMGKNNNKKLPLAVNYLEFLGTNKYTADQISQEFYRLACNFGISAIVDRTYLYLTGLQDNFEEALALFEHLISHAKVDKKALKGLVENTKQERANQMKDKGVILRSAMVNYAKYGTPNPFNNTLSEAELEALDAEELVQTIHKLKSYTHRIYYYGILTPEQAATMVKKYHDVPAELNDYPATIRFEPILIKKPKVFFCDFDMVQANIYWLAYSGKWDPSITPLASLFNEYFGGSMGSIVFQTLREAKALAYSTTSRFEFPTRKEEAFFTTAFIGTQADKIHDAIEGMNDLLQNMPETNSLLENATNGLKSQIEAQRIIRQDILISYDNARRLGLDYDQRKDVYIGLDKFKMEDIKAFHDAHLRQNYTYCILASKEHIKLDELSRYGDVEELDINKLFGY